LPTERAGVRADGRASGRPNNLKLTGGRIMA